MRWTLYGAPGWGSTLAECALAWTDEPFDFVDVDGFDQRGPARDRLIRANPLARVPTLAGPGGLVLTESAAIILHLAERNPDAALAPPPTDPDRPIFLDRLAWFVSAVYPTFTYRDYPERWAPSATEELVARIDAFRCSLWSQFEDRVGPGPHVLAHRPSALDIYVAVMSRWRPGRAWFRTHCPKLHEIALAAEALPALAPVIQRNFGD
ncbi:MAG TPA: glutathione S-transferase [Allosphingosinicella sp.]|nr:glutathione S-transferase [Allosphingosinicella sp.]